MSSVGETLRRERLRKDRSLEQISRETKISTRMLDAIEHDQFDQLPGGVFAKSFVRQYARVLALDEEELAAEVQKAIQTETALPSFAVAPLEPAFKVPKLTQWESSGSSSNSSALPSLAMVVAVMLVCSGIYAWWQRSRRPAPPPAPRPAAHAIVPSTIPRPPEPAPVTPAVAHNPETPAKTDVAQSTTPPEPAPAEPAATNPAATLHVSMTASENNWVRAWADGKEVMTRVLNPALTKTVEAVDEIRIRTGDAGTLQITLNGKVLGPIGPRGQVRIVQVTRAGVQILPPPPKPAPAPEPL
jgi:cytoskeleton protein RodZ